jgi:hypothetical protein
MISPLFKKNLGKVSSMAYLFKLNGTIKKNLLKYNVWR